MNKYIKLLAMGGAFYTISTALISRRKAPAAKNVKPYFKGRAPYIFAHRGGLALRPEHTMLAFKHAQTLDVDGFEIDIRLTRDNEVVVLHDAMIDRVSNGSGLVYDHTLAELQSLDFGYRYTDINGNHPFRAHPDAKIVTLSELIRSFPAIRINIDIKDAPNTAAGARVIDALYAVIDDAQAFDQVLITSFHDEQIRRFRNRSDKEIAYGAGEKEVARTFLFYRTNYKNIAHIQADTFQIPTQFYGISLAHPQFIQFLQSQNVVPGYWVINSIDQMKQLLNAGAHTIVTDRPDIAMRLKRNINN
ncbi:glycerophosphodiester phosphodiesterase [Macrococcoides canis]|uniref:glycerophosphodiester phosphodiesterase n=1 Tax=Macrococcoides canis TaxID=1855823 RepID=UPI00105C83E2|nr:glycerophosphodiester phosphodiesterase [Macrococcus canis]MEE1106356.1 glycerophosphodiester phosphodiesterase [Macrococcus canis]TDM32523.1 glycerophosphodiester phosphodiesterase [Macrococcus canis]TDM34467.1 glycerophosphodiester phosphodiesterase [Macrococcus canis]